MRRDADTQGKDRVVRTLLGGPPGQRLAPLRASTPTSSSAEVVQVPASSHVCCCRPSHSFTTRKGQKFCGDPKQQWVQMCIKKLDARRKKASPRVGAMSTKAPVQSPANTTSI